MRSLESIADAVEDVVALVAPQRTFREVDFRVEANPHCPT